TLSSATDASAYWPDLTSCIGFFFFFNVPPTATLYTFSLHDALPISHGAGHRRPPGQRRHSERDGNANGPRPHIPDEPDADGVARSEEHTSELQSRSDLVCRLLLEKKKSDHPRAERRTAQTHSCCNFS